MTELNGILRDAVQAGCNNYSADVADFSVRMVFDLDPAVGELSLVETDFGEAMLNLVRNACYAMELKKEASDVAYRADSDGLVALGRRHGGNPSPRQRHRYQG